MVKIGKYYPLYVALFTSSTLERKQHTIKQKRAFYTFLVTLCFRRVLRAKIKGFRTITQKIVVQQLGDIHQQGKVDALAFQHLVGVGTVAVDRLSKPGHRAPLPLQLRFDHVSYVYLVSHRNSAYLASMPSKKRVVSRFHLLGGSAKPDNQIKESSRPNREHLTSFSRLS